MSYLARYTKFLLKKYKIRPKKRLSQSFLIDEKALSNIVSALYPSNDDIVVDFGAGLGVLTFNLAKKVKFVIGVELDKHLIDVLRLLKRDFPNVEIVHANLMNLNFVNGRMIKVVSNVPYHISSNFLIKLIHQPFYSIAVLTLQKEVVDRMIAAPGTRSYGRLSIIIQLYSNIEIICSLPPSAFYPSPKVYSTVIRLIPDPKVPYYLFDKIEGLTRLIFSQRKKKLKNALKIFKIKTETIDKDILEKRVFQLTPKEIINLVNSLNYSQ